MELKFDKDGLISAIVQDAVSKQVLMLGYMNAEALKQTQETGLITFFSRSRQEIWKKGATSGNYLRLVSWSVDCDNDALLFQALPDGPTCHTGNVSCFPDASASELTFLSRLEQTINDRFTNPKEGSYIQSLIGKGLPKIAQKVGEEGVEIVIEAMRDEPESFLGEAADLLFHYLVLLRAKNVQLKDVLAVLEQRAK